MSVKKKSAKGAGTPQGTKANKSTTIVSKIIDIVNLSDEEIKQSAVKKLADEDKQINNSNRYISAVHTAVLNALCEFCKQNAEFAQAVCQSDRHFNVCLAEIVKGVKGSISDLDLYTRAVKFYFSTATIHFQMLIDVGDGVLAEPLKLVKADEQTDEQTNTAPAPLVISLDSLLDW
ncbi:MAG: hypothetical protein U0M12_07110 [Acutalibacteraceae bacterium]|nr:hypothetical protein [Acutalibacteraceae bacterium]